MRFFNNAVRMIVFLLFLLGGFVVFANTLNPAYLVAYVLLCLAIWIGKALFFTWHNDSLSDAYTKGRRDGKEEK